MRGYNFAVPSLRIGSQIAPAPPVLGIITGIHIGAGARETRSSQAERRGTDRAGLARAKSSIPTTPGHPTKPQTVRYAFQGDIELMVEKEVLNLKPAPRLEQVSDKRPEQLEYRKHRTG